MVSRGTVLKNLVNGTLKNKNLEKTSIVLHILNNT